MIKVVEVFPDFENAFILVHDGRLVLDASCLSFAISVGEVAAFGIILILIHLIIIIYHLVLENHSIDLALVLRSVILHAFFYQGFLHSSHRCVEGDGHIIVQELQCVVHKGGQWVLPLYALAHRLLAVTIPEAISSITWIWRTSFDSCVLVIFSLVSVHGCFGICILNGLVAPVLFAQQPICSLCEHAVEFTWLQISICLQIAQACLQELILLLFDKFWNLLAILRFRRHLILDILQFDFLSRLREHSWIWMSAWSHAWSLSTFNHVALQEFALRFFFLLLSVWPWARLFGPVGFFVVNF